MTKINAVDIDTLLGPPADTLRRLSQQMFASASTDPERLLALKAHVDLHIDLLATAIVAVYRAEARHEIVRQATVELHTIVAAFNQGDHR